jgi:subtilisin family serine protease
VDPRAREAVAGGGSAWMLIGLTERADLSPAYRLPTKSARGRFVVAALRSAADRSQPPLVHWLTGRGVDAERFWVQNTLRARLDAATLAALAARPDVASLRLEGAIRLIEPVKAAPDGELEGGGGGIRPLVVESGIKEINADEVWKMGIKGQNVVVAITDTGVDLRHPALKKNYRGYPQMTHDYNWLDAVKDEQDPLDVGNHGTHVTGTIIGSDPVRQIGVAPGAKFISCRLIENRSGTDGSSLRCLQWIVAPTKLDGSDPSPDLAPDVVNASWGNEPGRGCLDEAIHDGIRALEAAGILFVASAGNSGDKCQTVCVPGAYPEALTVANYDVRSKQINQSSSRGPAGWPGGDLVKPDIAAPGTEINSSIPPTRYDKLTGTSMASPHIAGAAALLLSAKPELKGRPEMLRLFLETTARKGRNTARCGTDEEGSPKDNIEGVGVADVQKAVVSALTATPVPPPTHTPTRTPSPTATDTPPPSDTPDATATDEATPTPDGGRFSVYAPYTARRWNLVKDPVAAR